MYKFKTKLRNKKLEQSKIIENLHHQKVLFYFHIK